MATLLKDSGECKLEIFKDLKDKLIYAVNDGPKTPPAVVPVVNEKNYSINSAKFVGSVPGSATTTDFIEGGETLYYKFTVKETSTLDFSVSKYTQRMFMNVQTAKKKSIASYDTTGRPIKNVFFITGDYFLVVTCGGSSATAFKIKIEGAAI